MILVLAALAVTYLKVIRPRNAPAVRRAGIAAGAMLAAYYDSSRGLLAQYPAPNGEPYGAAPNAGTLFGAPTFKPTAVWDYSWALNAMEDMAQLPGGSRYLPIVRTLTNNLQQYWDAKATVPAYAPTVNPGAGAVKYYDDNAWVGLDLVTAYHLTGNATYLQRAEAVFHYEETGWDTVDGGIYWNDQRLTRNTPSTAPVAELGVYLYRDTHNATYLDWAKKIYAWQVNTLVDKSTGQVWDNINASGKIVQTLWTYNQGTVIGAGVLLYETTHQASYLAQANQTASFVLHHAIQIGGTYLPQAQFNGVLVDNLQLLYQATHDPAITQSIATNANTAWTKARNAQNLIGPNWGGPAVDSSTIALLTQTGGVRLMAVAAAMPRGGFTGFWL